MAGGDSVNGVVMADATAVTPPINSGAGNVPTSTEANASEEGSGISGISGISGKPTGPTAESESPPCSPRMTDVGRDGRRSSAGSGSDASGLGDEPVHQLPPDMDDDNPGKLDKPRAIPSASAPTLNMAQVRLPPSAAAAIMSPRTFEQVMSPRSLANGKRFLSGFLHRRVPVAAGLLKGWRRQFFRLRDHAVVCYKDDDAGSAAPLFEICFTAQSLLQADRLTSDKVPATNTAIGPLTFVLRHVEILASQQQAKVEVPVVLRADNEAEFADWLHCLQLKMNARRQMLTTFLTAAVAGPGSNQGVASLFSPSNAKHQSSADDSRSDKANNPNAATTAMSPSPVDGAKDDHDDVSPLKARGNGKSQSILSSIKRSLSFGRRDSLLFGTSPDDPPEFAQFRNRYLLMREIGEGSFSIVHKAVNRLTGRLCAIKCCKYSPALVEEVGIMKKLRHPNIVQVEGVFKQDDMHYVVLDYMGDGDLCDMLIKRQRLEEDEARRIVAQVLQGIEYMHRHCVLHRDIKPENILLHGDNVKIADFGLAKLLAGPDATVSRSCGTLEYAAPELICGREYGLKSDIFSLGVVLYVLLFGSFPFSIESASHLHCLDQFPPGVDVRDMSCLSPENYQWHSVTSEAQDVILRMLEQSPDDRISAAELLTHPWFVASDDGNSAMIGRNPSTTSLGSVEPQVDQQHPGQVSDPWQLGEITSTKHEAARMADCDRMGFRELMFRGLEFTKFGFRGSTTPHPSLLRVDLSNRCIVWTGRPGVVGSLSGSARSLRTSSSSSSGMSSSANSKRRTILLDEVTEVRVGHSTDAFERTLKKSKPAPPPADRCLSIICARRTLDIVVKTASQRAFVERGLTELLASLHLSSKPRA